MSFENIIFELYREFDRIIGEYLYNINEGDILIVLSDHGHGMRCTNTLNLNEFLRKSGYLNLNTGKFPFANKKYWIEKAKNYTLQLLFTLQKEEWAYYIAKLIPNAKELKTSAHIVSNSNSIAHLSDFAGMGPYGGIVLNLNPKDPSIYNAFLKKIISDLEELNKKHKGLLFKWIKPRDSVIKEKNNLIYPDILFELCDGLGVNWGMFLPLITRNPLHRRISGGHNMHGILATNTKTCVNPSESYAVQDIKKIILCALGVNDCKDKNIEKVLV